ncbi:MAG: aconitate hydratase, partial [Geminicoccales bacterium]
LEACTEPKADLRAFIEPAAPGEAERTPLVKGPNIKPLPRLDAFPDALRLGVAIKVGDDISTDEIMPAGAEVMPYRSNIPEIARFVFRRTDSGYVARAEALEAHCIVAGVNYGQGSSREHAAIAPRFLGLRVVVAKGFARLHAQNLINFGVLPLTFVDPDDYEAVDEGQELVFRDLHRSLRAGPMVEARISGADRNLPLRHALSERQIGLLLAGGMINRLAGGGVPENTSV